MELPFLDTESLDSFGLPPNTLSDLRVDDTSGLSTIRPPTVRNRLGLRRQRTVVNPSTSSTVPAPGSQVSPVISQPVTSPQSSDGYPNTQTRYILLTLLNCTCNNCKPGYAHAQNLEHCMLIQI